MGVLPEALVNYLALLGWAPTGGTREIFSAQQLITEFSLERVTPSPAIFDMEKLYWLNRHYIKESPAARIEQLALPYYGRLIGGDEEPQGPKSGRENSVQPVRVEPQQSNICPGGAIDNSPALSAPGKREEPSSPEGTAEGFPHALNPESAKRLDGTAEAVPFPPGGWEANDDGPQWPPAVVKWLGAVTRLLAPSLDRLEQLPEKARVIFSYDPKAALASPDNTEVLSWPNTKAVISRFTVKILADESAKSAELTAECFKQLVTEVKSETGAKGKELFHPIRLVVTGSHSGPEFDKLIPILEEGSRLKLPKPVLSVRERVEAFGRAWGGDGFHAS